MLRLWDFDFWDVFLGKCGVFIEVISPKNTLFQKDLRKGRFIYALQEFELRFSYTKEWVLEFIQKCLMALA